MPRPKKETVMKKSSSEPAAKRKPLARSNTCPAKPVANKKAVAKPKPKKKKAADEDEEDEEDYDYDYDYDYDAEEEEEEEGEGEEEEGEEEDEKKEVEPQAKNTKQVPQAKVEELQAKKEELQAKVEVETAARFDAMDQRLSDFIKQFTPLLEVHEAYTQAQKLGGWSCKADSKQPALERAEQAQRIATLETQVSVLKEQLVAQEASLQSRLIGESAALDQSLARKSEADANLSAEVADFKKVLENWVTEEFVQMEKKLAAVYVRVTDESTSREQLQSVVQQGQSDKDYLYAELSRLETAFGGTSNCLACGSDSPPSTPIRTDRLGGPPRRNQVGAPVSQFLSREWEHDKFDPKRPGLKKGGGFSTTATGFFGKNMRKPMSKSQSSPAMGGSRRKQPAMNMDLGKLGD